MTLTFDAERRAISGDLLAFSDIAPLVDGRPLPAQACRADRTADGWLLTWPCAGPLEGSAFHLEVRTCPLPGGRTGLELRYRLDGLPADAALDAFGLNIGVDNARAYLRSGTHSWDGTFYVPTGARPHEDPDETASVGYAVTQFLVEDAGGAVLGFLRHDRAQHRFTFADRGGSLSVAVETLWDRARHQGMVAGETLVLFEHPKVENGLRVWAEAVVAALPRPPRTGGVPGTISTPRSTRR